MKTFFYVAGFFLFFSTCAAQVSINAYDRPYSAYIDQAAADLTTKIPPGWEVRREKNNLVITCKDSVLYKFWKHDLNPDYSYDNSYVEPNYKYKASITMEILYGNESWTDEVFLKRKEWNDQIQSQIDTVKSSQYIDAAMRSYHTICALQDKKYKMPVFRNCGYTVLVKNNLNRYFYFYDHRTTKRDFENDCEEIKKRCAEMAEKWFNK
jgi:hypothetical protein